MKIIIAAAVAALSTTIAQAHGGGLNAEGCHTNRKTSHYHCHRSASGTGSAPARSYQLMGAGGTARPFANCTAAAPPRSMPARLAMAAISIATVTGSAANDWRLHRSRNGPRRVLAGSDDVSDGKSIPDPILNHGCWGREK